MKRIVRQWVGIVLVLVLTPFFSWAEDGAYLLKKGTKEIGIGSGFAASFESNRVVNMIPLDLCYGIVVTDPLGASFLKGNVEMLGEATGDYVFHNQRKYGVGISGLVRYNLLWSDCFKPFIEAGIGVYHTNLEMEDFPNDFNFLSQGGIGFNWFVLPAIAIQLDYRIQHLSNAGIYDDNTGLNLQKGGLGIAYFF
ncbi:MAG: acyloxyacyl hydrolase [Desulfobacterota bacterium]|nr:acyloxyacyl hydrolase [Thermodesulfobacteriota bacterium]